MALTTVYGKTEMGRLEVKNRSANLSVIQRRVLILVDGRRTAEKILRISKVVDYAKVLSDLEEMGYIETVSGPTKQVGRSAAPGARLLVGDAPIKEGDDPKSLMLGTLQSYSSPVKTADLIREINQAETNEELKILLDRWYHAVSDNPYAAPIVDDLRTTLIEKLL